MVREDQPYDDEGDEEEWLTAIICPWMEEHSQRLQETLQPPFRAMHRRISRHRCPLPTFASL